VALSDLIVKPVTRNRRRDQAALAPHPGVEQNSVKTALLLAGSTPETLLVQINGSPIPVRARTTLAFDAATIERAIVARQFVVVVFENGDPTLPIVTGALQPPPPATPLQDLLTRAASSVSNTVRAPRAEARVDGKRVVLEGNDEVVLKCGEASITLRRDGKIILRGTYVETNAKGVNRIKGGSVKIN
jgi:hypothetical protein